MDTITESALKADSGRKIPCRTGESNLYQCYTWLFSLLLYQLNYPTHCYHTQPIATTEPPFYTAHTLFLEGGGQGDLFGKNQSSSAGEC